MYTRLLYFQANAKDKPEILKLMDRTMPKIRAQRGCKDCLFLTHDEEGRYALLVFWETRQNADVAAPIIGPELLPGLNKFAKEPVTPLLFEVYEPATKTLEKA